MLNEKLYRTGFVRISSVGKLYAAAGAALCGLIFARVWWDGRHAPALLDVVGSDARHVLSTTLFYVGGNPVRVLFVLKCILFLCFLNILSRVCRWLIERFFAQDARFDEHRRYVFSRILTVLIYVVGCLIGFRVERISLHTFVLVGGTLGIAIGLGIQRFVGNFIAGLVLLIEQPVRLGDYVEFGNHSGTVVRVGSSNSWIRTPDNALLILPNSDLISREVLNWTARDRKHRIQVAVSVAYGTGIKEVMEILQSLALDHSEVLHDPGPTAIVSELGPNGMTFRLRVWTELPALQLDRLRSDLYLQIVEIFKERGIEMPFPQLDVHWKQRNTIGR